MAQPQVRHHVLKGRNISIDKYQIPGNFETWMEHQIQVNELEILPIQVAHAAAIAR